MYKNQNIKEILVSIPVIKKRLHKNALCQKVSPIIGIYMDIQKRMYQI